MNEIKPGVKTSELWVSVGTALVMMLVALGIITQAEADSLVETVMQFGAAAVALIGAVAPIVAYIQSRTKVKAGG